MQSRNIDYAITTLHAVYWTVMAMWFVVLVANGFKLTGSGTAGFLVPALLAILGWHFLRYKRKKLQEKENGRPQVEG